MRPGQKATAWIETYCVYPHGFGKGQHVRLTAVQKEIVHKVFDSDESPEVTGPLAAYLALFHSCRAARSGGACFPDPTKCRFLFSLERDRPRPQTSFETRRRERCLPRTWHEISARGRVIAQISRSEKT